MARSSAFSQRRTRQMPVVRKRWMLDALTRTWAVPTNALQPVVTNGTATPSAVALTVTTPAPTTSGGATVLPLDIRVTDNFTGTNGDPWNTSNWTTTLLTGTSTIDIQGNTGRMTASGASYRDCLVKSNLPSMTDTDVLLSFQITDSTEQYVQIVLRGNNYVSGIAPANAVILEFDATGSANLYKRLASSYSTIGTNGWDSSRAIAQKMWVRFQVLGTTARARWWNDGLTEPTDWVGGSAFDVTVSDAAVTNGNVYLYFGNGASGTRYVNFDDLVISSSLSLNATLPAPTASSPANTSPSTIVLAATTPAPTASGGATTTPSAVTASVTVPAPTASSPAETTPSAIVLTATIPAPTASGASAATPAAIALAVSAPSPTTSGSSSTTPSAIVLAATVPDPTATGETGAVDGTATPTAIELSITTPSPTTTGGSNASPTAIALSVTVPSPTGSGNSNTTPSIIALAVSVPSPTVSGGTAATPPAIALAVSTPSPTSTGDARAPPSTVVLDLSFANRSVAPPAEHYWDVETWSGGTDPLLDTGTVGGIDLAFIGGGSTVVDGAVFQTQFEHASDFPSAVPVSDWSLLWVGTYDTTGYQSLLDSSISEYYISLVIGVFNPSEIAVSVATDISDFAAHQDGTMLRRLPETWIALTRSGDTLTLYREGADPVDIPHPLQPGATTGDGGFTLGYTANGWLRGGALWEQALTEQQLIDAAAEFEGAHIAIGEDAHVDGETSNDTIALAARVADVDTPVIDEHFDGSDGDPWDPAIWDVNPGGNGIGSTVDIQSGQGRMLVDNPGYADAYVEFSVPARGTLDAYAEVTIIDASVFDEVDLQIHRLGVFINPAGGTVTPLWIGNAVGVPPPASMSFADGDTVKIHFTQVESDVEVYVWITGSQPGTPTFAWSQPIFPFNASNATSLYAASYDGTPGTVLWDNIVIRSYDLPAVITGDANTAPASIPLTVVVPDPDASGEIGVVDGTATPSTIALNATVPAPSATGGAMTSPPTVTTVVTTQTPTATGTANTTPSAIVLLASCPSTTSEGGGATTPSTVARALTVPAPTSTGEGIVSPSGVARAVVAPTPSVTGGSDTSATPSAIVLSVTVPNPTASGGGRGTGSTIVCGVSVPSPSISGQGIAAVAAVALLVTLAAASLRGNANVSPSAIDLAVVVPDPTTTGTIVYFPYWGARMG